MIRRGAAYRSGDYGDQIEALDGYYAAVEANLIHCTQWNYTADNTHEFGDGWNAEDPSIYSPDDRRFSSDAGSVHAGGRALAAIVRPYPRATAGEPLRLAYSLASCVFSFELRADPHIDARPRSSCRTIPTAAVTALSSRRMAARSRLSTSPTSAS